MIIYYPGFDSVINDVSFDSRLDKLLHCTKVLISRNVAPTSLVFSYMRAASLFSHFRAFIPFNIFFSLSYDPNLSTIFLAMLCLRSNLKFQTDILDVLHSYNVTNLYGCEKFIKTNTLQENNWRYSVYATRTVMLANINEIEGKPWKMNKPHCQINICYCHYLCLTNIFAPNKPETNK